MEFEFDKISRYCDLQIYSLYQKKWYSQNFFFLYMKLVHKYVYLISYQSGINALSIAILIILFGFVNQELCHVLSDEAKSRLCHFLYLS